jgi:hypothetical protein
VRVYIRASDRKESHLAARELIAPDAFRMMIARRFHNTLGFRGQHGPV